jgi:hypothetical protein
MDISAQPPPTATPEKRDHIKTKGEKKFDLLTYTGINYVANVLLSIGAVYWVERTRGGQKFMHDLGEWVGRKLPSVNKDTAKLLASKSFFLAGGFAVLAPVKWMEDAKVGLVKKWNRDAYGAHAESDPVIVQSEREMEEAPKQTWGTVVSSRVLSLIPFYLTVGLLWTRTSMLARATNPELANMSKQAAKAMEEAQPAQFSQIASKGVYFDKPIGWASRVIGKAVSKLTGNKEALAKIQEMEATYPGMIKEGANKAIRDPDHSAIPYYFISEAITSGAVAAGMYGITRVLAPIMGKKSPKVVERHSEAVEAITETTLPAAATQPEKTRPSTAISTRDAAHVPPEMADIYATR